jgi:hypothetical protein
MAAFDQFQGGVLRQGGFDSLEQFKGIQAQQGHGLGEVRSCLRALAGTLVKALVLKRHWYLLVPIIVSYPECCKFCAKAIFGRMAHNV